MNIQIPPALASMGPVLQEFFEAMVHKLYVNSHKDALQSDDIDGLLAKMEEEIREFREQRVQDAEDPNILAETADSANFAFLLYAYLRARGVRNDREQFLDEFLDVDPLTGRVFCKKTRRGSPHKVGDEVWGSGNPSRIRTQYAVSGTTVSILRRDIVWWKHHGQWPTGALRYKDSNPPRDSARTVDCIDNLLLSEEPAGRSPPFVSQYCPRGREGGRNYGRWVYQRRHAFKLVRVGYWDTPEEAAREGIRLWKAKTSVLSV